MGSVPLSRVAWEDLTAWMARRPACASDALFVTLRRSSERAEPAPLTTKQLERSMLRHARKAGLPAELSTPHVLRHSFCTRLAEAEVSVDVIRDLARHADVRTTLQLHPHRRPTPPSRHRQDLPPAPSPLRQHAPRD